MIYIQELFEKECEDCLDVHPFIKTFSKRPDGTYTLAQTQLCFEVWKKASKYFYAPEISHLDRLYSAYAQSKKTKQQGIEYLRQNLAVTDWPWVVWDINLEGIHLVEDLPALPEGYSWDSFTGEPEGVVMCGDLLTFIRKSDVFY